MGVSLAAQERGHHGLQQLPAALQLLASLMNSPPRDSLAACAGAALLSRSAASIPAPPLRLDPHAIVAPEPDSAAPPPARAHSRRAAAGGQRAGADGGSRAEWEGPACAIAEEELVRDLLFVLQSIDGAHIKWDAARDSYALPRGAVLPPGARQLVGRLSELGWLFRQVSAYVHAAESGTTERGVAPQALVPQAFRHALQVRRPAWLGAEG